MSQDNALEHSRFHLEKDGYKLSSEDAITLTEEFLDSRLDGTATERFICFEVDGNDQFSNIGRYIESVRFKEYFDNSPEQLADEYGPYEPSSTFFVSLDQEKRQPAGVLRVIKPSIYGLKTLNDVSGPPLHLDKEDVMAYHGIDDFNRCWDIGTVAAMPEYKAGASSIQLYRAIYLAAMKADVAHLVSMIDSNVHSMLSGYLGVPFVPLAGTKPIDYLGSEKSQAVYGSVLEFYPRMNRHRYTLKGLLARKALGPLVAGTKDSSIRLK